MERKKIENMHERSDMIIFMIDGLDAEGGETGAFRLTNIEELKVI